ncbi:hypothetical protein HGRIS_005168 [Hohenbuehelia grisea]|uniref:BTB domain-containing protein n=1 Tax=Hohenbuehelia grisea TaxID=104357 RepID=A0ABR3JEE8_9AGAR
MICPTSPSLTQTAPSADIMPLLPTADVFDPATNVVLRSSDKPPVDFRVPKTLLSLASPFFAGLLALPQPSSATSDQEMSEGSPVLPVSESSAVLERLLPYCYPRYTSLPELKTLEEVQSVLAAASKYDMSGVEQCLGELLLHPRFVDAAPLRVFATACQYSLGPAARAAAKATLRLSLPERRYVPELEHIPAGALQRLVDYYFACSDAAAGAARDLRWIKRDAYAWFDREPCACGSSTYVLLADGAINAPARAWWLSYMRQSATALAERPHPDSVRVGGRDLMEGVFEKTKGCACGRRTILDMLEFRELFAVEVERKIDAVELCLKM